MKYYLTLDIGGTFIKYAVANEEACLLLKGKTKTPSDNLISFLRTVAHIKEKLSLEYHFSGVAISTCGLVDPDTGLHVGPSAISYLHKQYMKHRYEEIFNIPVSIENDAYCAALAEAWKGAAQTVSSVSVIILGTGVGGAILLDGKLLRGVNFQGGQFGFQIGGFKENIPQIVGKMVSTRALIDAAELMSNRPLTGEEIFEMADSGHTELRAVIEEWYRSLATVIFNIQYSIDPDLILIGGGISEQPKLIENIYRYIDIFINALPQCQIRPKVEMCHFRNNANLIGALYNHFSYTSPSDA